MSQIRYLDCAISTSFSRLPFGNGRGGECSIHLRRYRGSETLICSAMRINDFIGKTSDLSWAYEMEGSATGISRVPF